MNATIRLLFLFACAIKTAPVLGFVAPELIPNAYGISVDDPNLVTLLRHRAALFAVVAGLLAGAAFRPELRAVAIVAGLFSMFSFHLSVLLQGDPNAQLARYALIDAAGVVALVLAFILIRTSMGREGPSASRAD